jgi:hypothetical protein
MVKTCACVGCEDVNWIAMARDTLTVVTSTDEVR